MEIVVILALIVVGTFLLWRERSHNEKEMMELRGELNTSMRINERVTVLLNQHSELTREKAELEKSLTTQREREDAEKKRDALHFRFHNEVIEKMNLIESLLRRRS